FVVERAHEGADGDRGLRVGGEYDRAEFQELDFLDRPLFAVPRLVYDAEAERHAGDAAVTDRVANRLDQPVVGQPRANEQAVAVLTEHGERTEREGADQRVLTVVELQHR